MNILLTTFGATWQIIPELLGFTNPGLVDLYANHPYKEKIRRSRQKASIEPVHEVWVITTCGGRTSKSLASVSRWAELLDPERVPVFRVWQVEGAEDLASEAACGRMGECIHRLVLHGSESSGGGQVLISLAGGRKTMSSDIQNAAMTFGCHALLHVIQNETYAQALGNLKPSDFTKPFPADLRDAVTPLVAGRYGRSPVVDLPPENRVRCEAFRIPPSEHLSPVKMRVHEQSLVTEVRARAEAAGFLYCNYTNRLMREESGANFLALYHLPPHMIERLKRVRLGVDPARHKVEVELDWLRRLPKTDLHCHLGGVAEPVEILEIARANRHLVERYRPALSSWLESQRRALEEWSPADRINLKQIRKSVPGVPEPVCAAAFALLLEDRPGLLDEVIYGPFLSEAGFCGIGFQQYEALGDLQGSGLLQTEQSLRAACRILARKAARHNVKYLEVRCSPANYQRGGVAPSRVARIVDRELSAALSSKGACRHKLIFIASRHGGMEKVREHVQLALELSEERDEGFSGLGGFDIAGDERAGELSEMRSVLMPLMKRCLHFTIHAGETQDVSSIWEAVYHLNAERIGHGLTLGDNPELLSRFRDRNIAVEMCPSSNFQIVGFKDAYLPQETGRRQVYPLKEYLDKGLLVTVNTDNPGISRTDPTQELHRAARLTPGGLSLWDLMRLIRNGFKAAFLPRQERHQLILDAEREILDLIQEGLPF